jgi:catechol 2,3-dioxygenase-like lactoylglutathione lyase family enzyme
MISAACFDLFLEEAVLEAFVHHVSLATSDLPRALAFYCGVLGLRQIDRPALTNAGAWLETGASQIHLIEYPNGTFRRKSVIDNQDVHFALRVADFEAAVQELAEKGYREDAGESHPRRVVIKRRSPVGFPQIYLIDPDEHVVEINAAA